MKTIAEIAEMVATEMKSEFPDMTADKLEVFEYSEYTQHVKDSLACRESFPWDYFDMERYLRDNATHWGCNGQKVTLLVTWSLWENGMTPKFDYKIHTQNDLRVHGFPKQHKDTIFVVVYDEYWTCNDDGW